MKNLKIKSLSIILTFLTCIITCCFMIGGCSDKYSAEFYSKAHFWMSKEFIKEHKVYNIYYEDGNPKEGDLVYEDGTYVDRTSPKNYTYIINDEEQFKSICTEYDHGIEFHDITVDEIDFDKRTVILYFFCSSNTKEYNLKNVEINEKTAKIYYKEADLSYNKEDYNFGGHTTWPYARCFMVVLDKADITSAEFIEV